MSFLFIRLYPLPDDGSIPQTHALMSLFGPGIIGLHRNPQDVFDLLRQQVRVLRRRCLHGGSCSFLEALVLWDASLLTLCLSAEWMSTASGPAAAMREGAIRCNPFPEIGVPDTSHDPLGHSFGYLGSAGTFHATPLTP